MSRHSLQLDLLTRGIPVYETQITMGQMPLALSPSVGARMAGIADTFNAAQVWADVQEGGKVGQYQQQKQFCIDGAQAAGMALSHCDSFDAKIANANFRGNRGANAIRDGLRALGYSPGSNNTAWGAQDASAWKQFTSDHGLPAGPGLVNKAGIDKMEALLQGDGGGGGGGGGGLEKVTKSKFFWPAVGVGVAVLAAAALSGRK